MTYHIQRNLAWTQNHITWSRYKANGGIFYHFCSFASQTAGTWHIHVSEGELGLKNAERTKLLSPIHRRVRSEISKSFLLS